MKKINKVTTAHLIECAKLYVDVFNGPPRNDQWTFETAKKRLSDIFLSQNFAGIIYIEDGQILGAIFGNYEQFYDGIHYNLKEMFVRTDLQRSGVGSKMLNEFEKQLKELGVTEIILFTSKGDQTFNFYIKNAFSHWDSLAILGKQLK